MHLPTAPCPPPPRRPQRAARWQGVRALPKLAGWCGVLGLALLSLLTTLAPLPGWAQTPTVELAGLRTRQADGSLDLEFAVRLNLPKPVEEALQRGVPVYFVAEAQLYRNRWYWRDERVARVQRLWRVAYQPLTGNWRVGLGGLNQTHATLADALAAATRSAGWRLTDLAQLDRDKSYYLEFRYRLDNSQLPGPMQLGLGGQNDWSVNLERTLRLDLSPERPLERAPERPSERPSDRPPERPAEAAPLDVRPDPARPEARP